MDLPNFFPELHKFYEFYEFFGHHVFKNIIDYTIHELIFQHFFNQCP
jgi:hypothetical protein